MNVLREYELPQRDAVTVTLYQEGVIQIEQPSPLGDVGAFACVQLDTFDLGELINILDSARLAWERRTDASPQQAAEPPAEPTLPPKRG
jgi:hypothetical protein